MEENVIGMLREIRAQWDSCMEKWVKLLGLTSWQIAVDASPLGDHRVAETEIVPAYNKAWIKFDPVAIQKENVEEVVVHELAHIVLHKCMWHTLSLLPTIVGDRRSYEMIDHLYTIGNDELAEVLARVFIALESKNRGEE